MSCDYGEAYITLHEIFLLYYCRKCRCKTLPTFNLERVTVDEGRGRKITLEQWIPRSGNNTRKGTKKCERGKKNGCIDKKIFSKGNVGYKIIKNH